MDALSQGMQIQVDDKDLKPRYENITDFFIEYLVL
jgi:hypothetical protein